MVHLSQYIRQQDNFVCPPGMSQGGIATSLGISRAHAAIELKRAMDAGRVTVRIAHVTGASSRRKVYALTPRGKGIADAIRGRALSMTTELFLPDGQRETMEGRRAFETLRRHGIPDGHAVVLLLTHGRIDVGKAVRRRLAAKGRAGASAALTQRVTVPSGLRLIRPKPRGSSAKTVSMVTGPVLPLWRSTRARSVFTVRRGMSAYHTSTRPPRSRSSGAVCRTAWLVPSCSD